MVTDRSAASSGAPRLEFYSATAQDKTEWWMLWELNCTELGTQLDDTVSEGLWRRILSKDWPVGSLLARRRGGGLLGFANYIVHPHTWSLKSVCYLEDLFVISTARRQGIAGRLIDELVQLGRQHGWRRVYWHTHASNHGARALYDRLAAHTDYVRYDIEL
jgi:GNAT superfamily N-acetyltransferase